mgnify:CR=1 FL=1
MTSIKTIKKFQTSDGEEFKNLKDAEKHEEDLKNPYYIESKRLKKIIEDLNKKIEDLNLEVKMLNSQISSLKELKYPYTRQPGPQIPFPPYQQPYIWDNEKNLPKKD